MFRAEWKCGLHKWFSKAPGLLLLLVLLLISGRYCVRHVNTPLIPSPSVWWRVCVPCLIRRSRCSVTQSRPTPCNPWITAYQASLFFTISQSLLKLMSIELVKTSNHLILCHSLLQSSIFPSITGFSNESVLHIRWPKYWSFSFSISPSNEYSGLISFGIDQFDLLDVQGTLKSLLQNWFESINSSALSLLYVPTLTATHDS